MIEGVTVENNWNGSPCPIRNPSTSEFDLEAFDRHYGKVTKLFAVTPQGRLRVYSDESRPEPKPGWKIIFVNPVKEARKNVKEQGERAAGDNGKLP